MNVDIRTTGQCDDMETFDRIERQYHHYARSLALAKLWHLSVPELRVLYKHYTKEGTGRLTKETLIEVVADYFIDDHENNPDAMDY